MNAERATGICVFRMRLANAGWLCVGILLALLVLGFESKPAYGQAEAGTVSGTVKDATGAVVAGAMVTAKNLATSAERTVQSGENGQYGIPGLTPGIYEVTVSNAGFAAFKGRVEVTVGGRATLDAQLSVSNQVTTVEVIAEGGTAINTQTQELSQVVSSEQISQLPSLTRNPYDFVAIAGNVSSGDRTAQGGDQSTTGRGVNFAINGQRESGTEVLLDGVENIDLFDATYGEQIPIDSVSTSQRNPVRTPSTVPRGNSTDSLRTPPTRLLTRCRVRRRDPTQGTNLGMQLAARSRRTSCFSSRARSGPASAVARFCRHMSPHRSF